MPFRNLAVLAVLAFALAGCPQNRPAPQIALPPGGPGAITIIGINDVYRINGVDGGEKGGVSRVRALRAQIAKTDPNVLVLHAGDILFPSLLSRSYNGNQMIDVLNYLDGDGQAFDGKMFAVFGNHEFDKSRIKHAKGLQESIRNSQFTWLSTNVVWRRDKAGTPLITAKNMVPSRIIDVNGTKVAVFGLTTDVKHPEYVVRFSDYTKVAKIQTAALRKLGADVVIGLTHLTADQDLALLNALGADGPDFIFGGHEHNRLQRTSKDGRMVIKADGDAVSAAVIRLTPVKGKAPKISYTYAELKGAAPKDAPVQARVDEWLSRHDREFCTKEGEQPGCLAQGLTKANVNLIAEEHEIRKYETNLGSWVMDRALEAYAAKGAQAAVANSGSLRINYNINAGQDVTRQHVEELFAYPSPMVMIDIDGRTLQKVLNHAVTDWTGNGRFLQVAGLAFRHDTKAGKVTNITLLTPDGPKPVAPGDKIRVVAPEWLVTDDDRDGYKMINSKMIVRKTGPKPDLKQLVIDAMRKAGSAGIAPKVEGRICTSSRKGPCLAAGPSS